MGLSAMRPIVLSEMAEFPCERAAWLFYCVRRVRCVMLLHAELSLKHINRSYACKTKPEGRKRNEYFQFDKSNL